MGREKTSNSLDKNLFPEVTERSSCSDVDRSLEGPSADPQFLRKVPEGAARSSVQVEQNGVQEEFVVCIRHGLASSFASTDRSR